MKNIKSRLFFTISVLCFLAIILVYYFIEILELKRPHISIYFSTISINLFFICYDYKRFKNLCKIMNANYLFRLSFYSFLFCLLIYIISVSWGEMGYWGGPTVKIWGGWSYVMKNGNFISSNGNIVYDEDLKDFLRNFFAIDVFILFLLTIWFSISKKII